MCACVCVHVCVHMCVHMVVCVCVCRDNDEDCDDGNILSGDGCDVTCHIEHSFHCKGMTENIISSCYTYCEGRQLDLQTIPFKKKKKM